MSGAGPRAKRLGNKASDAGDMRGADTALLIVDMINQFDFPEGEALLTQALPAARRIGALKRRLKAAGVPVIYVNDNFMHWHSEYREIVRMCSGPSSPGAPRPRPGRRPPGSGSPPTLRSDS